MLGTVAGEVRVGDRMYDLRSCSRTSGPWATCRSAPAPEYCRCAISPGITRCPPETEIIRENLYVRGGDHGGVLLRWWRSGRHGRRDPRPDRRPGATRTGCVHPTSAASISSSSSRLLRATAPGRRPPGPPQCRHPGVPPAPTTTRRPHGDPAEPAGVPRARGRLARPTAQAPPHRYCGVFAPASCAGRSPETAGPAGTMLLALERARAAMGMTEATQPRPKASRSWAMLLARITTRGRCSVPDAATR